jgi:hypothetical protein
MCNRGWAGEITHLWLALIHKQWPTFAYFERIDDLRTL